MLTDFSIPSDDLRMSTALDFDDNSIREAPVRTAEPKPTESPFRFAPLVKSGRSFLRIEWADRDQLFERME